MKYFFTDSSFGNLALHVENNPLHVKNNRAKLSTKVSNKKLIFMEQVHGDKVEVVDKNSEHLVCDAMITQDKDVALCVMVADCIPVILYDEQTKTIGVAHAGRNGSYKGIVKKTIVKMCEEFTCRQIDIKVVFGPCIKKCCYEVGAEVIKGFLTESGVPLEEFTCKEDEKNYLDLIALNTKGLSNIEVDSTCTCCDERYFSYRRDGMTGRFCGVICL